MKLSKTLAAASLLVASTSAMASSFYFDLGTDYDNPANAALYATKVNSTSTSIKDYFGTTYQSQTIVTTQNANVLTVGDTIKTYIGILNSPLPANVNTQTSASNYLGLNPTVPGTSNNGLNNDWFLSFTSDNLIGTISDLTDPTKPQVNYTAGTIALMMSFDFGVTYTPFVNLIVQNSNYSTSNNLQINGYLDFTGVNTTYAQMFKEANGTSFYDDVLNNLVVATFELDQNLTAPLFTSIGNDIKLSGTHGGQLYVNIPEPATLGLLGIGLLGAAASRRKSA